MKSDDDNEEEEEESVRCGFIYDLIDSPGKRFSSSGKK